MVGRGRLIDKDSGKLVEHQSTIRTAGIQQKKNSRNGRYWDKSFFKNSTYLTIFTDMTGPVTAIL